MYHYRNIIPGFDARSQKDEWGGLQRALSKGAKLCFLNAHINQKCERMTLSLEGETDCSKFEFVWFVCNGGYLFTNTGG